VNTLYCLEEWRGEQRISPPGDNFTPRGQNSPLGTTSPLGSKFAPRRVKLRMGLRVNRLVEFLPVGRLFTLGSFVKITEVAQIMDKAAFWETFSQTHQVTLIKIESVLTNIFPVQFFSIVLIKLIKYQIRIIQGPKTGS
jgi:hypothetical protein